MFSRIKSLFGHGLPRESESPRFRHLAHYENILGTSLEIQIVSSAEKSGPQAEAAVLAEIDRLEKIFNAYNPSSELSLWQSRLNEDIVVSQELAQLLWEAEKWRVVTKGAFNSATEALTRLWAHHAQSGEPVNEKQLRPLVERMSAPLWSVDLESRIARRLVELPVTLNSIAKGFIIDRACEVASQIEAVTAVLVNIGGDLRHFGPKSSSVAIADPHNDAENALPIARVAICNAGLATSGNYRRGFRIGGQWYSHILDPRTGWPVESLIGVSVVAPSTFLADVLATAFSVLEPAESIELADSLPQTGVLLIQRQGQQFSNSFWEEIAQQ